MNWRSTLNCLASFGSGALVSTGYPAGIVAGIAMPAFSMNQTSRLGAYQAVFCYYAGASWPVIPAARNFFGVSASVADGIAAWFAAAIMLAIPWGTAWTKNSGALIWRVPLALVVTIVPPLGIIGWASPLTAAGLLFPGTAWAGVLANVLVCAVLCVESLRQYAVVAAAMLVWVSFESKGADPKPPLGWEAVNTHFGAIAHGPADPIREYEASQWVQNRALSSQARFLIFPEMVVPRWTAATNLFWQPTLAKLSSCGKTILVGAGLPNLSSDMPSLASDLSSFDFAAASTVLDGASPIVIRTKDANQMGQADTYRNAIVIRGAETGTFLQHIPVPLGMWHPLNGTGVPLNLFGPAEVRIGKQQVGILICYEQLLTLPFLLAAAGHPTVMVGVANDYWVEGTPIPRYQATAVRAWGRLFGIPVLLAVNK